MESIIKAPTQKQYETIYELSKKLNSIVYQESLMEEALDLVVDAVDAERGLFAKYSETGKTFSIIAARNLKKKNITSLEEFSSGVLNEVISKRKPVLYHDAQAEPRVSEFESIRIKGIKSVIGVPILHGKNLWGIILADSQRQREKFTQHNLVLLDLFSNLISLSLDRIISYEKLKDENLQLQNQLESVWRIPDIIGESPVMKEIYKTIRRVAKSDATVLITGESGTGKDLVARAIHFLSSRKDKPYIARFCGAIPDSLLESELFGYKKGAFTGATSNKKGLLEAANNGSFFLDEIADISFSLQAKLLRVLENKEITMLGDTNVKSIDVRIITATNKNLQVLVKKKEFREDLFYRLNVFPIKIPPLRERKGDVPILAAHITNKLGGENITIETSAIEKLDSYNWPGNVRQLTNVLQRAIINSDYQNIKANDIIFDDEEPNVHQGKLEDIELAILKKRLQDFNGNKTLTAKSLGVSRKWIYLKLDGNEN